MISHHPGCKCWHCRPDMMQNNEPIMDNVNHPKHYTNHPSGVECIQVTEHMNFCLGNAIKYIWRAGFKEGSSMKQDLEKAIWYLQREIQKIERI